MKSRAGTYAWRTLAALVLVAVLYLVAINAFLLFGGYAWALSGEKDVDGRVDSAWSPWPGRVHARGLDFIVHDPSVEAHLHLDEAKFDLELLAFFKQRVRIRDLEAQGVSFRLRKARPLEELCAAGPGLPPIPTRPLPPDRVEGDCLAQADPYRPPGPKPDPEGLFRAHLTGIRAVGFRELWLEKSRLEMEGSFNGSWSFWPTVRTEVTLGALRLREGTVTGPSGEWLRDAALDLSGHLGPLELRTIDAEGLWRALTVEARVEVKDVGLAALLSTVRPAAPPDAVNLEGRAVASATVSVEAGRARRLTARAGGLAVAVSSSAYRVAGRAGLELDLAAAADGPGLALRTGRFELSSFSVKMPRFSEERDYPETWLAISAQPTTRFRPAARRLHAPFRAELSKAQLIVDLVAADVPRLGAEIVIDEAQPVEVQGQLEVDGSTVALQAVVVKMDGLSIDGATRLAPELSGGFDIHVGPVTIHKALGEEQEN